MGNGRYRYHVSSKGPSARSTSVMMGNAVPQMTTRKASWASVRSKVRPMARCTRRRYLPLCAGLPARRRSITVITAIPVARPSMDEHDAPETPEPSTPTTPAEPEPPAAPTQPLRNFFERLPAYVVPLILIGVPLLVGIAAQVAPHEVGDKIVWQY